MKEWNEIKIIVCEVEEEGEEEEEVTRQQLCRGREKRKGGRGCWIKNALEETIISCGSRRKDCLDTWRSLSLSFIFTFLNFLFIFGGTRNSDHYNWIISTPQYQPHSRVFSHFPLFSRHVPSLIQFSRFFRRYLKHDENIWSHIKPTWLKNCKNDYLYMFIQQN